MRYQVQFQSVKDIINFSDSIKCLECRCEIISGNYRVNAKSVLAIFTLPFKNTMIFETERIVEELPEQTKKYIIGI